ncbi:hypothetical protein QYE76_067255 [Lolium multiflorum]|uniref:Reverse transcriptase domain-containing protein n=1 Tax=Lolium multiflorum TaxID=4521 RepID=A0AAD8SCD0_LOLMU|nr:hypothetical protein QYE76_067255 [Lolium multiflorum]
MMSGRHESLFKLDDVHEVAWRMPDRPWWRATLDQDQLAAQDDVMHAVTFTVLQVSNISELGGSTSCDSDVESSLEWGAGEPIPHGRGLRQGDPLPLLFVLAIDPLSQLLELATDHGLLHRLHGRGTVVRTSLYADDAAVFVAPIKEDIMNLASILQNFGEVTGLRTLSKARWFRSDATISTSMRKPIDVAPLIYAVSKRKNWKVSHAMNGEAWISKITLDASFSLDHFSQFVDLWSLISTINLTPEVEDDITWRLTPSGNYTAKSAYELQLLGSTASPMNKTIWKAWAPPKLSEAPPDFYTPPTPRRRRRIQRSYYFRCPLEREVDVVFINNRTCDRVRRCCPFVAPEPIVIKIFYALCKRQVNVYTQQQEPPLVALESLQG